MTQYRRAGSRHWHRLEEEPECRSVDGQHEWNDVTALNDNHQQYICSGCDLERREPRNLAREEQST